MGISLNQADDQCQISLEGAIDICSAAELKEAILSALSARKEIRLSLEKAADLDVTAVQLLWAARREAKRLGVGIVFQGRPSQAIQSALAGVGFGELALFD